MQNTELVKTLRTLNKQQQEGFLLFLESPYCTKGKKTDRISSMCRYIFEYGDKEDALSEIKVYKAVYPELNTKNGYDLSNRRSEAMLLFRDFTFYEEIEATSTAIDKRLQYANFCAKNNLLHSSDKEYKKIDDWVEGNRMHWTIDDYFTALKARMYKSYFFSVAVANEDIGLTDFLNELDIFYLHLKLHYGAIFLGMNNIHSIFTTKIKELIEVDFQKEVYQTYLNSEHGALKATAFRLLFSNSCVHRADYENFKLSLIEKSNALSEVDFLNYWTMLRHIAHANAQLFDGQIIKEVFTLLKLKLSKDFIHSPKKLKVSNIYAGCHTAIQEGEIEWAKEFLARFIENVEELEYKEETKAFCMALIAFGERNFDAALDYISSIVFSEVQLKILYRLLELKILFETDSPILESRVDSTSRYLRREKKLGINIRDAALAFGNVLVRMMRADYGFKKAYTQKILDDVRSTDRIAEKEWLLEVIRRDLAKCKA